MSYFQRAFTILILSSLAFCQTSPTVGGACHLASDVQIDLCPQEDTGILRLNLDTIMERIKIESFSAVKKSELLNSQSFEILYKNPNLYQNEILQYISDTTKLFGFRSWAISSQSACDDHYYNFSNKVITLYAEGKFEEKLLFTLIDPGVNKNLPYIRNDRNLRFRQLLKSLAMQKISEDLSRYIQAVLSDYVCANLVLYR